MTVNSFKYLGMTLQTTARSFRIHIPKISSSSCHKSHVCHQSNIQTVAENRHGPVRRKNSSHRDLGNRSHLGKVESERPHDFGSSKITLLESGPRCLQTHQIEASLRTRQGTLLYRGHAYDAPIHCQLDQTPAQ